MSQLPTPELAIRILEDEGPAVEAHAGEPHVATIGEHSQREGLEVEPFLGAEDDRGRLMRTTTPMLRLAPVIDASAEFVDRARRWVGVACGPTLEALLSTACRLNPRAPELAFSDLWMRLFDANDLRLWSERVVRTDLLPFVWTGGDGNHFAFLWDESGAPADERPIVKVYGCDVDSAIEVVAANLADFLSLVAIAFAEVVSRSASDEEWFGFREGWYSDDPELLGRMRRQSEILLSLPGVRRLDSPRSIANAWPTRVFAQKFVRVASPRS